MEREKMLGGKWQRIDVAQTLRYRLVFNHIEIRNKMDFHFAFTEETI